MIQFFNGIVYTLCDVLYSSKLCKNLISRQHIDAKDGHFMGNIGKVSVFGPVGEFLFVSKLKNGIYTVIYF